MLQGKELAAAIRSAMALKGAQPGAGRVGPTALGRALGITQPSATELLQTGRLSKEKLPLLLAYFEDVVGPDHFGLPFTKMEVDFIMAMRRLPASAQEALYQRVTEAAKKSDDIAKGVASPPFLTIEKLPTARAA